METRTSFLVKKIIH